MECFSQIFYIVELQYTHVASLDPTEASTIVVSTLAALAHIKLFRYAEIFNFHFEEQFLVKENEESFEILRISFFQNEIFKIK